MLDWVRDGLMAAVQLVVNALGAAMNGVISAWPIGMPALPTMPSEMVTAFAWLKWSPLPVTAAFAFVLFAVTVWLAWMLVAPVLRWARLIGGDS